jgi:hypothetical protein
MPNATRSNCSPYPCVMLNDLRVSERHTPRLGGGNQRRVGNMRYYSGGQVIAGSNPVSPNTCSNAGQNTSDRAALLEGFLNEKTYEVCRRTRDRRHDAPDQCRQRGAGLAPCPAGRHVDHHWGAPAEHAADGPGHHPRRNDGQRASGHGKGPRRPAGPHAGQMELHQYRR